MPRLISSVHIDIARFLLEVSEISASGSENLDKKIADWTRSLAKCLALRDPSINKFGAELLSEAKEFSKIKSEKARESIEKRWGKNKNESNDIRNDTSVSNRIDAIRNDTTDQIRSDQIRSDQIIIIKEKEKKSEVSDLSPPDKSKSQKKIFDEASIELEAAKFFWSYLREWSPSAIEPSPANYQGWAKDIDAMFRIDRRSTRAFNELLDWIDRQPESKSGFSWRKNIHSPASLRQRWREGKFADFLPTELSKEEFR